MTDSNQRIAALPPEQREVILRQLRQKALRTAQADSIPSQSRAASSHPLSFAQQRLWFLDQLEPGNPLYNVPAAVWLEGKLDVAALERSFSELVRRHESLRTTFHQGESGATQRIAPAAPATLPIVSLETLPAEAREAEALRLATAEARRTFDLGQGPLWRAQLFRLDANRHLLVLVMHHIVSDGWSVGVLVREMAALYEAYSAQRSSPLPEPRLQYLDFSAWQHERLQGQVLETQLAYWRKQLEGAPEALDLPTDRPRPVVRTFQGARAPVALSPALTEAVKLFSQREGVTPFMTLLAAFQVLLARYSGQEDVCVGSPVAGRTRAELEGMIGVFINTLVLRARPTGELSFRELVQQVREGTLGAFAHQEVPFEKLVDALRPERRLDRSPLFQHMFILQNAPMPALELAGLKLRTVELESQTARFDLTLSLAETARGFEGELHYSTELFDAETVERLCEHYQVLLEAALAAPSQKLGHLSILSQRERQVLLHDWNPTPRHVPRTTVHDAFQAQVALRPDAIAVESSHSRLTFAQLEARSNQLAHLLRRSGVGPESRVALCLERSVELIVSLLAILKAGGAYVPLDPDYPRERLASMLADARPQVLLTSRALLTFLPTEGLHTLLFEEAALEDLPSSAPLSGATSDNLVYIDFTSGSTGRPKGVCIQHASVLRTVLGVSYAHLGPEHCLLLLAPISFDASTLEVWGSLLNGARLVLFPPHPPGDVHELEDILLRHRVTTLHLTSGLFTQMVDSHLEGLRGLQQLLTGGDVVSAPHVRRVLDELRIPVTACYGPTENTLFSTCLRLTHSSQLGSSVPIGTPLPNSQAYVLDRFLQPLPVGVAGELFVSGEGLARGYLESPELTAEKFLPNPFSSPGSRMYRTGDRARFRSDGVLEFLGRGDHQVKIRGFRVELAEVEAALRSHSSVRDALVLALGDASHSKRLIAYVVSDDAQPSELRAFLQQRLPEYMLPASFLRLDAFPLTANGKLDRKALPAPDASRPQLAQPYAPPSNPLQEQLASLWAHTLRLQRVGIHDNFFELGGDSILSLQLISRARSAGLHFSPKLLFQHQTIALLAPHVSSSSLQEQGLVTGELPLTPVQRSFLLSSQPSFHHFNQSLLLELKQPLQPHLLEQALRFLLRHHDALRLRFSPSGSSWLQFNAGLDAPFSLSLFDFSSFPPSQHSSAFLSEASRLQSSFSWDSGLLFRAALFDFGPSSPPRLLLIAHHLLVDSFSWRLLAEDLEALYLQLLHGKPPSLPPKSSSFLSWAHRLLSFSSSPSLSADAHYWLSLPLTPLAPLPRDGSGPNSFSSSRSLSFSLDSDASRLLLLEVPQAFRSSLQDVLLTALAQALLSWTGHSSHLITLESHGREDLFPDVDLSRTVGWFSSLFPFLLHSPASSSLPDALRSVRDGLRSVPSHGLSFGLLRFLRDDDLSSRLASLPSPDISFNFLGQLASSSADSSLFSLSSEHAGPSVSPDSLRSHLLDISAVFLSGQLHLSFTYSHNLHSDSSIQALAQAFLSALSSLISARSAPDALRFTPADFPLASLSQHALDSLLPPGSLAEDLYPLSPMQQGMLFHSLLAPSSTTYLVQSAWRLQGSSLHLGAFRRAWETLVERHAILRSSFHWEGLSEPVQLVHPRSQLPWQELDWRGLPPEEQQARLESLLTADRAQGFDLQRPPLMRLSVLRLAEDTFEFVWTQHHLLLDGWSIGLLMQEMFTLYESFRSGQPLSLAPRPAYRDYIAWLKQQPLNQAEAYWREALRGFTAPTPLPGATVRASGDTAHEMSERRLRLSGSSTAALQSFARQHQLTLNTLIQASWALLLSRYSGESDVVFGSTVSGRPPQLRGVEAMIGLFINSLPLRIHLSDSQAVLPWLKQLQQQQQELTQYEQTPLVTLQGWTQVPRGTPLFETLLVFENFPVDVAVRERGADLALQDFQLFDHTNYPLAIGITPGDELELRASFDTSRFEPDTIERLLHHWTTALEELIARPEQRLGDVSLMTEAERQRVLVEWNNTAQPIPPSCAHLLFEAQAERTPDAPAVSFLDLTLSYRQLNHRSNQLAHHLRSRGVGPDVLVGLCLEPSVDFVVSLLAILKAGGAFLPLDPAYPSQRLAFMLQQASAPLLLSSSSLADQLPSLGNSLFCLDSDWHLLSSLPSTNPSPSSSPDNLAYVIFTSGSTGAPKGTLLTHRGLVNTALAASHSLRLGPGQRVLQFASIGFDASVWECFSSLLSGALLCLAPRDRLTPGPALHRFLSQASISCATLTPSVLAQTPSDGLHSLTTLASAGEACSPELIRRWSTGRLFLNAYGPTEATICASLQPSPDPSRPSIGTPLPNVRLYVLDDSLRPTPLGVPGQLFIAGPGLARGYLSLPALTAERFLPDPFSSSPGSRLYRTGDLVRFLPHGSLEFLGRIDSQVKLRGFRIELGEIEAALSAHPSVREAAVALREDSPGNPLLAAYLVLQPEHSLEPQTLRSFLARSLPEHMLPSVFTALDALPLSPSGKLDRKALPPPSQAASSTAQPDSAPRNDVEQLLVDLWHELLPVPNIGIHDDFFELGGHSLLATQIISRIQATFGAELPLSDLFEARTVAELAKRLDATLRLATRLQAPPLHPVPRTEDLPLSFAQQRLWVLHQLEPSSPAYNIPAAVRMEGSLDIAALEQGINELIRRHEGLRTKIRADQGATFQIILPELQVPLPVIDLTGIPAELREAEARRVSNEEAGRAFDLSREVPWSLRLLRLSEREHILLLTMHHIVSDGWSIGIIIRDLAALYTSLVTGKGSPLTPLPIQYADFASWQRDWLKGEVLERQLAYWRQQLAGAPPLLELPTDRPRPAVRTPNGATRIVLIPRELRERLAALGRREGATLFMTLLAGFTALLSRYSGQRDIVVGTDIAGRNHSETEGLVGFFINQLVLRTRLEDDPSFQELLTRTRSTALGAYAHQDLPFEEVVRELNPQRSLGHAPLFQVKFLLQNAPIQSVRLPELELRPIDPDIRTAKYDLTLSVMETEAGLSCLWEYSTDLFEDDTIRRMGEHLSTLLEAAVAHPEQRVSELPLMTEAERQRVLIEWNNTAQPIPPSCAHLLFEAQAERTPDAPAVSFLDLTLSYRQLNQRSNQLAHHLRSLGVGPDVLVGVCLEPSVDFVVSLLAILKAGGAFLPLDPAYPSQRLAFMLQQASAPVLLSSSSLADQLPSLGNSLFCFDSDWHLVSSLPSTNLSPSSSPDNLAYVIFTSGSTGAPKGTLLTHRGLVNTALAASHSLRLGPGQRVLQFASIGFDASVWECFSSLLSGALLCLAPRDWLTPGPALHRFLSQASISCATLTPSVLAQTPSDGLHSLTTLASAGEACSPELIRRWSTGRLFLNAYGPTEATICASLQPSPDPSRPSIGTPLPNVRLYVLDDSLRPTPPGVPGQLFIAGPGLARGYLSLPALTAERFLPDPFSSSPGSRLYRTGDLVRFLPHGSLEFLGRIDSQVKLRGFRIELGEIEAALSSHPSVREAAVSLREDSPGNPLLAAYLVLQPEHSLEPQTLRSFLARSLPEHMLPSVFVSLDALPLSSSGKLDRKALPPPSLDASSIAQPDSAPRNDIEQFLVDLWHELLPAPNIGIHDDFFELGGHSLLATQVLARIYDEFQFELPLREIFDAPTIANLAALIEQALADQADPAELEQMLSSIEDMPEEEAQSQLSPPARKASHE
ncbi:non-ribosomal peptide synthetase [Hyalangium versicolor]|uniref:non-ribosomal peptide synthetase n=1 Tax=Hyalangium versicolor TaxID=2861190 RepID=UPI001CCB53EF|nr:non-ribosomal peptide synthetase [Hyalangium versicolor]